MHKLSFVSLNVRGLNASRKRRAIFRQLHNRRASVIFLQETYSSPDQEKIWSNEWGSKIYFSHGSKHSKGVAILFNPKLHVSAETILQSKDGRILILKVVIEDLTFLCTNVYAPNDTQAQIKFFSKLKEHLERLHSENNIIMGGDFNCPLSENDKEGGRDTSFKKNVIEEIKNLISLLNLEDVWRSLHPKEKEFTWRTRDLKIKCRLDLWLITKDFMQKSLVQSCEIKYAPHCDHSLVTMDIQTRLQHPRGPGFWKLNNSLLEDNEYTDKLSENIPLFIKKYIHVEDKGLLWEMIKMEIRMFTTYYSKQKAKKQKNYEKNLLQEAQRLQKTSGNRTTPEAIKEYDIIKNKLDKLSFDRTRGACIRSKARWHEFGERSSKYFLNLEKRNYENKCITSLTKDDNSTITDPEEILEEQRRYYENLYSSLNPQVEDPKFNLFFENESIKKLDEHQKELCEGLLTENECKNALKSFHKDKTPGTDGLTAEFYTFFWNSLGKIMVDSFNYAFRKGELSISQRQGIIRLIPKKDKNLSYLKNWRPISLLNTDYKIATKALAMRLKKVLPNIINNAQTGYLPGRFIGENIRLISDILHYTADQNLEGIALFIDFEKAFDSLEWEYLDKALDAFNFGLDFKVWIRTLYNNISSCTINNGYASKPFTLKRGVRQGCPLSGLLFILAGEALSCAIRSRSDIRGILVANKEIKLSQYADDTTAFCKDEASLEKLLEVLNLFEECSGLKLNSSKTEALWLGKNVQNKDTPFEFMWPQRPIVALGTAFSYKFNLCDQVNFVDKLIKVKKLFNLWSQRDLSLYGKITIAKTLGLSKLISSSACLHTPPYVIDAVNKLIADFVWNGKKPKIKRDTLIGAKEKGGLDLPEYEIITKSLLCAWVKRMQDGANEDWMIIPSWYLKNVGGPLIFDCSYDLSLLELKNIPAFYIDILKTWAEVHDVKSAPLDKHDIREAIIWNNKNITIAGKSVYWENWHVAGILRIKDLLEEDGKFLSYGNFLRKFGLATPFTNLWGLIAAIPLGWKRELQSTNGENRQERKSTFLPGQILTSKSARNILIQKKFKEPLASSRLQRLGVEEMKISAIYKLPFRITRETKLSIFQFKIIHNILPCRNLLYKMNISESPLCEFCNELETLSHMLVNCSRIRDFWNSVLFRWNSQNDDNYNFDELGIMYGYNPGSSGSYIFNYYILLSKRHVFLQKYEHKLPNLLLFLELVKGKMLIQRTIAHAKGQKENFLNLWKPLLTII